MAIRTSNHATTNFLTEMQTCTVIALVVMATKAGNFWNADVCVANQSSGNMVCNVLQNLDIKVDDQTAIVTGTSRPIG
jgi:hypothetical protein